MKQVQVQILVLGLLCHACGDDTPPASPDSGVADSGWTGDSAVDSGAIDSGPVDSATDAGDAAMLPACVLNQVLVTTSDFVTAELGLLTLRGGVVRMAPGTLADQDTVPARFACTPMVLERGLGNLKVQSETDPLTTVATLDLDPPGALGPYASNPQVVLTVAPTKAYVVLGGRPAIVIVDPTVPEVTGEIDLSGFVRPADTDMNVDATGGIVIADRAYVGLSNHWFDAGFAIHFEGSVLAVIDTATDTLVDMDAVVTGVQGIALAGNNPWRGFQFLPATGELLIGASGDSFALDGRIERVQLPVPSPTPLPPLLDEATVGAEINGFRLMAPNLLVVLAGDRLIAFDPTMPVPATPTEYATGVDGFLPDRLSVLWKRTGTDAGLRVLRLMDGSDITPGGGPITVGTLPVSGVRRSP